MSGNKFLLDTNVVLGVLGKKIDASALPDGDYFVSFVTELELLSYPSLTAQEERRIKDLLHDLPVIDLSPAIKENTIRLRKRHQLKLPDAIIAATALDASATLVTNDKGFQTIDAITVVSVPALKV